MFGAKHIPHYAGLRDDRTIIECCGTCRFYDGEMNYCQVDPPKAHYQLESDGRPDMDSFDPIWPCLDAYESCGRWQICGYMPLVTLAELAEMRRRDKARREAAAAALRKEAADERKA